MERLNVYCIGIAFLVQSFLSVPVFASQDLGVQYLEDAAHYYKKHDYFKSARYAFAALEINPALKPNAYSWITLGLLKARLPHAASYFFIRTLQLKNKNAIRSVLKQTEFLLEHVGADLIRKYLVHYTHDSQYNTLNLGAYLYALGKEAIFSNHFEKAVLSLERVSSSSYLWPYALQLKASAHALLGESEKAISTFQKCQRKAFLISSSVSSSEFLEQRAEDLKSRCISGEARVLYQMNRFDEADRVYQLIPKRSRVWPGILFEQAWNYFSKKKYNQALGKLVSYKSPLLSFIFNPEIDVLRAQSLFSLCYYADVDEVIKNFSFYTFKVGKEVKNFVEKNSEKLDQFYALGKKVLFSSFYTENFFYKIVNHFIRSPYFQKLVHAESEIYEEEKKIQALDLQQKEVSHEVGQGFPGFLDEVLDWRKKSIQFLGGAFVKNNLIDYHSELVSNFEKISFIKLELLKFEKNKIIFKNSKQNSSTEGLRERGTELPVSRWDQISWPFNGEFWDDELGDYVFALESTCKN